MRSYEMVRHVVASIHEVHMATSFRDDKRNECDWVVNDKASFKVHRLLNPENNKRPYSKSLEAFVRAYTGNLPCF